MTPLSCSDGYLKCGALGEFCVSSSATCDSLLSTSVFLKQHHCPKQMVKCMSGECRPNTESCPSVITCPLSLPVRCSDNSCVSHKSLCATADSKIQSNLFACLALSKLLCPSDYQTCVDSLSECPSVTTCPAGHVKCWDNQCKSTIS